MQHREPRVQKIRAEQLVGVQGMDVVEKSPEVDESFVISWSYPRIEAVSIGQESNEGSSKYGGLEAGTSDDQSVRKSPPAKQEEERFGLGTKSAKLIRQEELRMQAVRSMAESAKRKSDALEERNAIAAFSRPEAKELLEKKQFFDKPLMSVWLY